MPHGTPLPAGERDRQAAVAVLPGQQQQMSVSGAFSIAPLRVEHVSAAMGRNGRSHGTRLSAGDGDAGVAVGGVRIGGRRAGSVLTVVC
jgi:hypothetical protein